MMLKRVDEIFSTLNVGFLGRTDQVRDIVAELELRNDIKDLRVSDYLSDVRLFKHNLSEIENRQKIDLKELSKNMASTTLNEDLVKRYERLNHKSDQ